MADNPDTDQWGTASGKGTMSVLWETIGRLGRRVVLTDAGWVHIIARHRDMAEHFDGIRQAISFADEIRRGARYRRRHVHYRRLGTSSLFIRVVVNYRPDEFTGWIGEVITAHVDHHISWKEDPLWP